MEAPARHYVDEEDRKSVYMSLKVTPQLAEMVRQVAETKGCTKSSVIRRAIAKLLSAEQSATGSTPATA